MLAMIYGASQGPLKLSMQDDWFILEDTDGVKETCAETELSEIVQRLRGTERPLRAITIVPSS